MNPRTKLINWNLFVEVLLTWYYFFFSNLQNELKKFHSIFSWPPFALKRLLGTKTNEDSCSPLSRWYSNFSRAKFSYLICVQHFLSPAMQVGFMGFIWIVTPDIFAKYWFEAPRYAKTLVLKIREFLYLRFWDTKKHRNIRFLDSWWRDWIQKFSGTQKIPETYGFLDIPKSLHPLQRINMFVLFEIVIFKAQECISSLDFFYFLHYYKRLHAIKIIIIWEWNVRSDQLLTAREINWRQ